MKIIGKKLKTDDLLLVKGGIPPLHAHCICNPNGWEWEDTYANEDALNEYILMECGPAGATCDTWY
tara:strand:+ start:8550 stop:8747 length:198 start_codon:yes stop_codon:yes gene_type:complete